MWQLFVFYLKMFVNTVSILTIHVPTVNDGFNDFCNLFKIWQEIDASCAKIILDFHKCKFLRPNAVAFLGGLIRYMESQGRDIKINSDSLKPKVCRILQQNGFLSHFGFGLEPWQGNSVPYREDLTKNCNEIVSYLQRQWLGRNWINISSSLQHEIVGNVIEIYENAFEHGKTDIGVFSCGQYYPTIKELKLTIVDFGVGIPFNVREFLEKSNLSAEDALRWSFQMGNTTKSDFKPHGVGLSTLKDFISINNGKLEIFSNDGYAIIGSNKESYRNQTINFKGTLVNITFQCKKNEHYSSMTEYVNQPFF